MGHISLVVRDDHENLVPEESAPSHCASFPCVLRSHDRGFCHLWNLSESDRDNMRDMEEWRNGR
jgi:hypothetical protein